MLVKLKTLIYENWFVFIASVLISFLIYQNIFLVFLLAFLFSWQILGNFSKAIFFSFLFLPTALAFKNNSFPLGVTLFLFFSSFAFLKKKQFASWLIFLSVFIFLFYLNHLEKLNLFLLFILAAVNLIFFSLVFLKQNFFIALVTSLIFFEALFLAQFLPFNFYLRTLLLISLLFLITKFAIIEKWTLSQ